MKCNIHNIYQLQTHCDLFMFSTTCSAPTKITSRKVHKYLSEKSINIALHIESIHEKDNA